MWVPLDEVKESRNSLDLKRVQFFSFSVLVTSLEYCLRCSLPKFVTFILASYNLDNSDGHHLEEKSCCRGNEKVGFVKMMLMEAVFYEGKRGFKNGR